MPRLMLDTNICIHAIKRDDLEVLHRLERTRLQDVAISSIVVGELWTGVIKSDQRRRNEQALNDFFAFVEILDWPASAARIYGEIRAELERRGRSIGAMDLLIAAHAIHERATLVTRNRREFDRIRELNVESWAA
jgi:tRNA(fMet)-specific endonuclease VapC